MQNRIKSSNNNTNRKPYYQKYHKGNNFNYQAQVNQYNNNYQPEEKEVSRPVNTQNINTYLQSLYQQHYLSNVYLTQCLNGNNDNDFLQNEFEDNYKTEADRIQSFNEPYGKMDSSINSDGN